MTIDAEPRSAIPIEVTLPGDRLRIIKKSLAELSVSARRLEDAIGGKPEIHAHLLRGVIRVHSDPISQVLSGSELGRYLEVKPFVDLIGTEAMLNTGVVSGHLAIAAKQGFTFDQSPIEGEEPGIKVTVRPLPRPESPPTATL